MNALKRAAEILREDAESIRQSHTLGGDWQSEDKAKADHDEMLAVAEQLDAMQGSAGVPDRWKAKVLKLCSAVENDEDLPPVKYALKCGRLINEVKDMLAAAPQPDHSPDARKVVPDSEFSDEFAKWWEDHGQFVRAGGGNYERTFAFEAWRHLYPRITTPAADAGMVVQGENRYGLDMGYFRRLIAREFGDLSNFRPDEFARVCARMAATADVSVLQEKEFRPAPVPVPWPKKEDITEDMRAGFERLYRAKAERDGRTLERNEQGAYKHLTVDSDWTFYQRAWADALEAASPAQSVEEIQAVALEAFRKRIAGQLTHSGSPTTRASLQFVLDKIDWFKKATSKEQAARLRSNGGDA